MKKEEQLRMLLHPEKYTDEQLAQMLDETRVDIPDTNKEWQRLTGRIKEEERSPFSSPTLRLFTPTKKIAAIFIGLLMLSGITYAAIHIVRTIDSKPQTAITERKPDVKKIEKVYGGTIAPTQKTPVIYNNVELGQIMQYIADGYDVKVEFKNEAARTIRFYLQWEADDTLQDIIKKINHFEKVTLTLNEDTITTS